MNQINKEKKRKRKGKKMEKSLISGMKQDIATVPEEIRRMMREYYTQKSDNLDKVKNSQKETLTNYHIW